MKYVVVGGYFRENSKDCKEEFAQCIGIFNTSREAYGEAILYLNDAIDEDNLNKVSISPLYPLEGETGYIMYLTGREKVTIAGEAKMTDYAQILFFDDEEDKGKHTCDMN